MANLQPSLNISPSFVGASPQSPSPAAGSGGCPSMGQAAKDNKDDVGGVLELCNQLSKMMSAGPSSFEPSEESGQGSTSSVAAHGAHASMIIPILPPEHMVPAQDDQGRWCRNCPHEVPMASYLCRAVREMRFVKCPVYKTEGADVLGPTWAIITMPEQLDVIDGDEWDVREEGVDVMDALQRACLTAITKLCQKFSELIDNTCFRYLPTWKALNPDWIERVLDLEQSGDPSHVTTAWFAEWLYRMYRETDQQMFLVRHAAEQIQQEHKDLVGAFNALNHDHQLLQDEVQFLRSRVDAYHLLVGPLPEVVGNGNEPMLEVNVNDEMEDAPPVSDEED